MILSGTFWFKSEPDGCNFDFPWSSLPDFEPDWSNFRIKNGAIWFKLGPSGSKIDQSGSNWDHLVQKLTNLVQIGPSGSICEQSGSKVEQSGSPKYANLVHTVFGTIWFRFEPDWSKSEPDWSKSEPELVKKLKR